jgi:hypothetical protein
MMNTIIAFSEKSDSAFILAWIYATVNKALKKEFVNKKMDKAAVMGKSKNHDPVVFSILKSLRQTNTVAVQQADPSDFRLKYMSKSFIIKVL